MVQNADTLLINARFVITDAYSEPISNGSVAISAGAIVAICKTEDITAKYIAPETIDMSGKILMPGLVDCHNHLGNWNMYAITGLIDEPVIKQPDRLLRIIYPAYSLIAEEDAYDVNMMGYLNAIKTGTTTVNNCFIWPSEIARAAVDSGLRVDLAPCIHQGVDYPDSLSIEDDLVKAESLIQKWHGAADGRIRYRVQPEISFYAEKWVFEESAKLSRKYGVGLGTHIAEDKASTEKAAKIWPEGELEKLCSTGFIGPNTVLYHGSLLRGRELEILKETGAAIAHCPVSNLKRGAVAAVPEMMKMGVKVGLGVDYPNNDLFNVMRIASLIHTILPEDHKGISDKEAFYLATQGGADALGIGDSTGSLTVGKRADIIALDTSCSTRLFPLSADTVINMIRLNGSGSDVSDMFVDGKAIMRNKKVLSVDERGVVERGLAQQQKFRDKYLACQREGRSFIEMRNRKILCMEP